jgi:thiol peroxidase
MGKTLTLRLSCFVCSYIIASLYAVSLYAQTNINRFDVLKIGKMIPDAQLKRFGKPNIKLEDLKGKVKIVSVVPRLNTPVCDEQTHLFSEKNGGLDKHIDIITISTNTAQGQDSFAQKAKVNNLIFLSDNPGFNFGENTGLLIEEVGMLRRTVLVVDEKNIIRYVDFVLGGGLPDIKGALNAAKLVLLEIS